MNFDRGACFSRAPVVNRCGWKGSGRSERNFLPG